MSTAKIYKRRQVWVIFLLIIITVYCCVVDTKPMVSGGNPPIIEFDSARLQLYVSGPFTLEQLKREQYQFLTVGAKLSYTRPNNRNWL